MKFDMKLNKYDYLIIVSILSLSYGNFELLGALWPIRIIGFIAIPLCIKHGKLLKDSIYRPWIIYFAIWWPYMLLSLLWTPDIYKGITYVFHMTSMMGCFMLFFLSVKKAKEPLQSVINGWSLFLLITIPIAIWEITTGVHLSSGSFNAGAISGGDYKVFAAVTFLNYNSYVLMLIMALPFIIIPLFQQGIKARYKLFYTIELLLLSTILIINASRTGIITLSIALILLCIYKYRESRGIGKFAIFFISFTLIFIIFSKINDIALFAQILARMEGKTSIMQDTGRVSLILNGIKIIEETYFVGGGIMSMNYLYKVHTTSSILYAHNMIIELLIEYGLIMIFFFVLFYLFLFRLRKGKSTVAKYLFWYILLSSPFMFIIDDCYQSRAGIWVFIASVVSLSGQWNNWNKQKLEYEV